MINMNVFMVVFSIIMFFVLVFSSGPVAMELFDRGRNASTWIAIILFALGISFFVAMGVHYGG